MPGGTGGMAGGGDASAGNPDEARLQALAGQYLMRMDMFSTATVQALPAVKLVTRNRISYLLVTELYVEGGQLKANERLCHQTFLHDCDEGCSTLKTTMWPAVTDKLVQQLPVPQRSYTVSNTDLTGNTLRMDSLDFSSGAGCPPFRPSRMDSRRRPARSSLPLYSTGFSRCCKVYSVRASPQAAGSSGLRHGAQPHGRHFSWRGVERATASLGYSKCVDKGGDRPGGRATVRFAAAVTVAATRSTAALAKRWTAGCPAQRRYHRTQARRSAL